MVDWETLATPVLGAVATVAAAYLTVTADDRRAKRTSPDTKVVLTYSEGPRSVRWEVSPPARTPQGRSTLDEILSPFDRLKPLRAWKSPYLAGALGFAFGALGILGYFRRLIDVAVALIIGIPVALLASVSFNLSPYWCGTFVVGLYGMLRAESSNRRLSPQEPSSANDEHKPSG